MTDHNLMDGYVICPHCGTEQVGNHTDCIQCNQKLVLDPLVSQHDRKLVATRMLEQYFDKRVDVRVRQSHQVQALLRGTFDEYNAATQRLRDEERKLAEVQETILGLMGVD